MKRTKSPAKSRSRRRVVQTSSPPVLAPLPETPPESVLDTMADVSDGAGNTLSDDNAESELTQVTDDDMSGFIVDDDEPIEQPDDNEVEISAEIQVAVGDPPADIDSDAPVLITPTRATRVRRKRHPVVPGDSDSEDLTALAPGDSMFSRSAGVKASLLPPSVETRNTRKKQKLENVPSTSTEDPASPPKKKVDKMKRKEVLKEPPIGDAEVEDVPVQNSGLATLANKNLEVTPSSDIERYITDYMAMQGPKLASSVLSNLMPALQLTIQETISALLPADQSTASSSKSDSTTLAPSAMGTSSSASSSPTVRPSMPVEAPFTSINATKNVPDKTLPTPAALKDTAGKVAASSAKTDKSVPTPAALKDTASKVAASAKKSVGSSTNGTAPPSKIDGSQQFASASIPGRDSSPSADSDVDMDNVSAPPVTFRLPLLDSMFNKTVKIESAAEQVKNADVKTEETKVGSHVGDGVKCLDDLESYKNKFDPSVPCGVADVTIQDEMLKPTYIGLPQLPGGRYVYASYVPGNAENDVAQHVVFSRWGLSNINRLTMESAMLLTRDGIYINPSRISPALIVARPIVTGGRTLRINVESKIAVCVSPGMCMESWLVEPHTGSGASPRKRKFLSLLFHTQEWERWESFMCLSFGEDFLFASMTKDAVHMGSILADKEKKSRDDEVGNRRIDNMLSPSTPSPKKRARGSGPPSSPAWQSNANRTKYALACDEEVPVYDATSRAFDFNTELPNLSTALPRWKGEIPKASFVVAGYTAVTYPGQTGNHGKQLHVGCNLLWAVVCGTPQD
ncbi:hypothetical protein B0H11DRAFT_2236178 [Mycena galericulata]|nr:hypothetical protein B0H11DRAFT_2236178 [Mycena galericulata]